MSFQSSLGLLGVLLQGQSQANAPGPSPVQREPCSRPTIMGSASKLVALIPTT